MTCHTTRPFYSREEIFRELTFRDVNAALLLHEAKALKV
jgi:hypothetical protein